MDPKYARQTARLNEGPLGQLCLELLGRLDEEYDPAFLYPLQLVQVMLEDHRDALPFLVRKQRERLLEFVAAASLGPPALNFPLVLPIGFEGESLEQADRRAAGDLKGKSGQEVGAVLAENLWFNLAKRRPSLLGPQEPLPIR